VYEKIAIFDQYLALSQKRYIIAVHLQWITTNNLHKLHSTLGL